MNADAGVRCDQRYIEVDGGAADIRYPLVISLSELFLGMFTRKIDRDCAEGRAPEGAFLVGPVCACGLLASPQDGGRYLRGIDIVPVLAQILGGVGRAAFCLPLPDEIRMFFLGMGIAGGEHSREKRRACVLAETAHLAGRHHVDTEFRIGVLQTVERELARLHSHVVKIEHTLVGLRDGKSEHDSCGKLYKFIFKTLLTNGKLLEGAQVALYHLDIVVAGENWILNGPKSGVRVQSSWKSS